MASPGFDYEVLNVGSGGGGGPSGPSIPSSPTDPPPPATGSGAYYNTAIQQILYYDPTRGKWLGAPQELDAGRDGINLNNSYLKMSGGAGMDGNEGVPVLKGTLCEILLNKTDTNTANLRVKVNNSNILTPTDQAIAGSAGVQHFIRDDDFDTGFMTVRLRDMTPGSELQDTHATLIWRRRA